MELAARTGTTVELAAGDELVVRNTHGGQVVDTWALSAENPMRVLSAPHTWMRHGRLAIRVGDNLVDNTRRPMLSMIEDSSPGDHDMLIPSCDLARYRQLGVEGYHDNCHDNFFEALAAAGFEAPQFVPQPLNLFMRVPIAADGAISIDSPLALPGDHVRLVALEDVVVVLSACPQDLAPTNGVGRTPTGVTYEVTGPRA
ncbi:urea carboxylase-associated family protein [Nocardia speluncae]|uniref:Urea carboxylase-associated family protein n=1 Tax=Nocardia speluncae TaxID=419477 RepID=A0A846XHN6_9NOCA|nr:urea carboxylase-associated family protein [Nocardia speluncae]NKY34997.1 urea carboxylase-associated family protein [Nocardia speluncae]